MSASPLDYALKYAALGWAVLPLYGLSAGRCTCGDANCKSPGKHPHRELVPHGVHDASKDEARVRDWFTRVPGANIGIATGAPSGFDALDVDPRNGGDDTLADAERKHGKLPDTALQLTGGGGYHYLLAHDPAVRLRSPGRGIDVKSTGGYIVAEPSSHVSGGTYAWEGSADPTEGHPIAPAPEWLRTQAPSRPATAATGGVGYLPPQRIADLRAALAHLDAEPYAQWIAVGQALHSTEAPEAFEIWDTWSRSAPNYDGSTAAKWRTFNANGPLHVESIFVWARDAGWDGTAPQVLSSFEQLKASADARKAAKATSDDRVILPDFPAELLDMPHGLGELQRWILGTMPYPSAAVAGFTAWAVLAHFAMPTVRIDSMDGLGVNEQFLLLAPTGFGKESTRKPFVKLTEALEGYPRPAGAGNLWLSNLPRLQFSAPASQQGLHKLLEAHRAQTFLADEFADWLGHSASDSHKQQALGHITQAYSKAFGTLAAPAAITTEYKAVQHPRVLVFATSTAEHILETITASHADRGALNRFVILPAEQDRLKKNRRIRSEAFQPPDAVVDLVAWIATLEADTPITFADEAWALYEAHDEAVLDPLKFRDYRLAGRLNEQAFKLAALVALADRRTTIEVRDLAIAYAIREGIYHRAASLIGYDGALSGMHATGQALEQLRAHLERKPFIYLSHLEKVSRRYARLSIPEREAVVRALQSEGIARREGGRLVSELLREEKP